ncbi:hypothetical protein HGM15179_017735 [Zosterops borbonicus]|uniref:Uncharacterized protein n=1 Tax=Zosterops borbonicus TaxID=364589 RepID=A0A8K1LD20_9PASS|nr:hypothetical protein HGM15179_017735 [Zosterops borbonicus]
MKAFVYQNRLALDYLLAEEEGVCGRFNKSECCIEIDDYGETIKGLAQEIKRWPMCRSRNGIQSSKLHGIIFLPCLIPCFIRLIHSVVQGMQIATLPMDPEAAKGGTVSKIMKLEEEKASAGRQGTVAVGRIRHHCRAPSPAVFSYREWSSTHKSGRWTGIGIVTTSLEGTFTIYSGALRKTWDPEPL